MNLCKLRVIPLQVGSMLRPITTSAPRALDQKWRKEKGLPMNPNSYGRLTDSSDYSYLDGRPTPYGVQQKQRIVRQREIAGQILSLSREMDFAVERHQLLEENQKKAKQGVLDRKLKPKGDLLLRNK